MHLVLRRLLAVSILAATLLVATGCGSATPRLIGADGGPLSPEPSTGTLGPGFITPTALPAAGSTLSPSPDSFAGVHPPDDYRVTLLTTDANARTKVLNAAVTAWAGQNDVSLTKILAPDPDSYISAIQRAIDGAPDLIVSTGDGMVDPLATVTASWMEQKFLILGAELAEPTGNVTAADWSGASFRGEGLGQASTYDPSSFTLERAGRALRAGVAAVLRGYSGYVVWVA